MSVAVCRSPALPAFDAPPRWPRPAVELPYKQPEAVAADHRPAQADIWNAIQADAAAKKQAPPSKPYVHPLVRRSSSLMSQKSLEVCTESLGNETGSGDFTSSLEMASLFDSALPAAEELPFWHHDDDLEAEPPQWEGKDKDLAAVNYHRSGARTAAARSPRRAFPPPLPSMSRRDGPCLQMRPRREDGRLVVEAVAVRPRGYLHARRQDGRLCLSFVECSARDQSAPPSKITEGAAEASYFPAVEPTRNAVQEEEELAVEMDEEDHEVDEEEEAVEVVDRGTVVEVKVSTQPQTAAKVHRSTLVINKFVGSTPVSTVEHQRRCHDSEAESSDDETVAAHSPRSTLRRVPSSTTSLAAAVAVASTGTDDVPHNPEEEEDECGGTHHLSGGAAAAETKQLLLFTSRRGDKQELLQSVRRCRQLKQKPLFILEQYCIATS